MKTRTRASTILHRWWWAPARTADPFAEAIAAALTSRACRRPRTATI